MFTCPLKGIFRFANIFFYIKFSLLHISQVMREWQALKFKVKVLAISEVDKLVITVEYAVKCENPQGYPGALTIRGILFQIIHARFIVICFRIIGRGRHVPFMVFRVNFCDSYGRAFKTGTGE